MDGLSAAASGIAVVSLAIQLVGSVRDIRRFLRNVSEAPKELRRSIDLLDQLELILENIGALIERQQKHTSETDIDVSESILRAMRTCESKLKILEDVVDAAKKTADATNKVTRTFGSFRLACKRRDIEEFESQLHDAINLLNLTMTTNLTMGCLLEHVTATNQMTTTISKELLLARSSPTNAAAHGRSALARSKIRGSNSPTESKFSKRLSMTVSSFSGVFGTLIVKKEAQTLISRDEEEAIPASTYNSSESSTWIFLPSFLSYAFDFRYLNTCGYVERALRTYPVLPYDHPVWNMCWGGNLKGIQKLLSDRQISPFSIDDRGNTMLHWSAEHYQAEICEFLFNIGHTGQETNIFGWHFTTLVKISLPNIDPQKWANDVERTYEVISSRTSHSLDLLFSRTGFLFIYAQHPDLFARMVRECLNKENINDCRFPPLALALAHFGAAKPNYRHRWKPTVQHLVNLGSDLHQGRSSEYTLLDHLMNEVDCPFESVSLGEKWLDILRESGVSVQEYLETEYRLHYNPVFFLPMMQVHYKTDDRPRSLVITEEPPSLSWDWFIDPAGKACDVLEEFKNLGWGAKYLYGCFQERNGIHWPFFYPEWQWLACRTADREPWLIEVVRHQNDRFERRCQRKAMKLAKAQGILHRGPRIPGAWID